MQVAGMFDVPLEQKNTLTWEHNLPLDEKEWSVGLIVGPSGAGKSVLARELWPEHLKETFDWDNKKTLLDNFSEELSTSEITAALNAVGLGTVPGWLRPYSTLSNGERFRADMARAITETDELAVIDEFTSVVDRQVAKVVSHCVQKTVRRTSRKFVAVTCHYDIEDWLQPDWVYNVAEQKFTWRSVQPRPSINLNIYQASTKHWAAFAKHHYLSASILSSAKCFMATLDDGTPVAFTSYRHFPHPKTKNIKMLHRTVVLPDFQGLGIGQILHNWVGQRLAEKKYRLRNVTSHPALIAANARSPRWRSVGAASKKVNTTSKGSMAKAQLSARRLAVRSFEYVPVKEKVHDV